MRIFPSDRVRGEVYDFAMRHGVPPRSSEVAEVLSVERQAVLEAFGRLAEAHILFLQPESGEILMAAPFSAVPTPFHVRAGSVEAYGNCIWDALGIPAMLHCDGRITTSCGDCGTALQIDVAGGAVAGEGVLHFAIPAKEWWNDLVFT